jgi:N-acetylglucosaminyl-diphospho-decaprenol L-rhamnosyltransferase
MMRATTGIAEAAVLIVGFNNPDDIVGCLAALSNAAASPRFDVFICENGGRESYDRLILRVQKDSACSPCLDETPFAPFLAIRRFVLGARDSTVTIGCADSNLGYAGGVNAWLRPLMDRDGWHGAWILNPDTEPEPDALRALVERAEAGRKGMVGSTIVEAGSGGVIRFRGGLRLQRFTTRSIAIGLGEPLDAPADVSAIERAMDSPSGASMYVTRRCIEQIGLMDESFFLFCEDLDWGVRAKKLGLGYAIDSVVRHTSGTTTGSSGRLKGQSRMAVYLQNRNAIHFTRRYYPWSLPMRFLFSLATALRYLAVGAPANFLAVLEGTAAGLRGETGRPAWHRDRTSSAAPTERPQGSASLDVFMPLPLTRRGPSYTCGMLSRGMAGADLEVCVLTPRTRSFPIDPAGVTEWLPNWARYVPFRFIKAFGMRGFGAKFLSQVQRRPAGLRGAYIWPDATLEMIRELKRDGVIVFREMINCHLAAAKPILDDAYARIGVEAPHKIDDAAAREEWERLNTVDYIFCANAEVERLLLAGGLPKAALLSASYGWEPKRLAGSHRLLESIEGITLVFVGSICVRKGCHLLLDYWAESGIRGRLVLAGDLEPTIRERFGKLLARKDVVVLDFVQDIAALYRSADVFVFPSLEEGGPQVTYEACGCALPVITTPMGAGRIVRHGAEGYVLDPYDREGWVGAMRALAEDKERRVAMGAAARSRAEMFRWELVAERRKTQILECLLNAASTKKAGPSQSDAAFMEAAQ